MAGATALGLTGAADAETASSSLSTKDKAAIETVVHNYLKEHPEVVLEALNALEAKEKAQRAESARKVIVSEGDALKGDPTSYVAGNPQGDVTLVEFFDYNCGYCRHVAPELQTLLSEDKKLKLVLKEWPIRGDASVAVSRVSLAASKQPQFLAFHFGLLASDSAVDETAALAMAKKVGMDMDKLKSDMKTVDTTAIIQRNEALASKIGIDGTPAFILGTTLIPGAISADSFRARIADLRKSCKQASC